MHKPWSELTEIEKAQFINGVGPHWFPAFFRGILTSFSAWFFKSASWAHHDYGYYIGHPSRKRCDVLFLQAMINDARDLKVYMQPFALLLALCYYALVRAFGWISYNRHNK